MQSNEITYGELFTGIGAGALAFREVFGDRAKNKFFSEINGQRVKAYLHHFPGHHNLENIDFVEIDKLPTIDVLIGGPPCQDLSIARGEGREGLDGDQSGLFYKYLDVAREMIARSKKSGKPFYFIMENVASMKDEDRDEISRCLGVKPVMISSVFFTGQNRERYYWTNFPIKAVPTEKVDPRLVIDKTDKPNRPTGDFIKLSELHNAYKPTGKMKNPKSYAKDSSDWDLVAWSRSTRYFEYNDAKDFDEYLNRKDIRKEDVKFLKGKKKDHRISHVEQRIMINMHAHTCVTGKHCQRMSAKNFVRNKTLMRPVNRKECLRLQGLPDDYLDMLSDSAAYAAIGDSFTLSVIVHILESLKSHIEGGDSHD